MRFEWDEEKSRRNLRKHKVTFDSAREIFLDPYCATVFERDVGGEERMWSLGRVRNLTIVVVAHTRRYENDEEVIRIISARKATPRERKRYEEELA